MKMLHGRSTASLLLLFLSPACGSGPVEPTLDRAEIAGGYLLSELSFDPQGSLPPTDVRERIAPQHRPTLTLTVQGRAQLAFLDPSTSLIRTVEGSFSTTASGARIDFGANTQYRLFLFSRRMELEFLEEEGTLVFSGTSQDGVQRDRLRALVPEWHDEQLLNPTPGELTVRFAR